MQLPCPVLSSNHVFVLPRQRILCWNLAATTVVVCYGYGGQRQNAASVSHPRQTLNRWYEDSSDLINCLDKNISVAK